MATGMRRANDILQRLTGRRLMVPPQKHPSEFDNPNGMEQAALDILQLVEGRSMTSRLHQYTTWSAVRYAITNSIPGAFVECGTWRGGHPIIAAHTLLQMGCSDREIVVFDTFVGMPPPAECDVRLEDGHRAQDLLAAEPSLPGVNNIWCNASIEDVADGLLYTGYPRDRVRLVKGLVEDTLEEHAPEQISVLRLDTDWYESTAHEFRVLWPRVASGGVVIIDDYDWWGGCRRATDEYLATLRFQPLLVRPGAGRVLIHP